MASTNPDWICNRLLVGVTGSVAASAIPDFIGVLRQRSLVGHVDVIMTRSACRFVTPYRMRLSSGSWVFTDTFQIAQEVRVPHVQLTRQAELFVIMPATANIIGKLASGICDDLVSAAAVACTCPLILVPTMNASMWENPIVQRNVRILRTAGRAIVEPARGYEVADWQLSAVTIPPFDALVRQLRAAMQSPQRESWPSGNGG